MTTPYIGWCHIKRHKKTAQLASTFAILKPERLPLTGWRIDVRKERATWTLILAPCHPDCQEEEDKRGAHVLTIAKRQPSVQVSALSLREPRHLYSVH